MSGAADEFNEFGVLLPTSNAIPLRYRDAELESLLRRLQSNRPSAIVVGPSGSGKTALIEAAATRLDRRFVEVNCGQMLVGTRYLGEAETRYKHLIDLCVGKKYIAYFTDIWLLYQTGRSSGHDNSLGTFLAPYVSRGDLVLVGECTDEQFHSAADDNRAFAATFGTVRISELTDAECNEILSSRLAALSEPRDSSERQAGGAAINVRGPVDIQIDELARRRVIEESKMAFPSIAAPGRVVRLLDAVISDEVESSVASNEEGKPLVVRQEKVIRVVEKLTGMSLRLLDEAEPLKADDVRNWLETRVLGQPEAIKAVVDVVMLVKSGMNRPDRPIAVMMFVGPTGVGKTELARRLAEYVFGSDSRLIRFDMAEFQDFNAVQRLAGSPFASDPAARDGLLNSKVRNQPFCVVLFDEIEKAHRAVHHMLLGVFGSGRLADPQGRTTDLTRCIMVMTSNLGSDISNVGGFGFKPSGLNLDSAVNDAMASFFSPEFRGRITRQVLFQPLGIAQFRTLAQREVGRILLQRGIRRRNVHLEIDPSVYDYVLAKVTTDPLGARVLAGRVEDMVVTPLAYRLAEITPHESENIVRLTARKGNLIISVVKPAAERRAASDGEGAAATKMVRFVPDGATKPVKLSRQSLKTLLADLQGQVNHLLDLCQQYRIDQKKTDFMTATAKANFWDDPATARRVHTEIHRLDSTQAIIDAINNELDQLIYLHRDQVASAAGLESVGPRAMKLQGRIALARYALHFQGAIERCQAFMEIRLVGQETLNTDPVGRIAGMYVAWAHSRAIHCVVLHEEAKEGVMQRAILLIEGVAMMGILSGERGLHEFHRGLHGRKRPASGFVEVRILPRLEEAPRLPPMRLTASKAQGKGKLVRAFQSDVKVDCGEIGLKMVLRGELPPNDAKELVAEYVAAVVHERQRIAELAPSAGGGFDDQPMRRYTLKPDAGVKDYITDYSHGGVDRIFEGKIDGLLQANLSRRLAQRQAYVHPAVTPSNDTNL